METRLSGSTVKSAPNRMDKGTTGGDMPLAVMALNDATDVTN